MLPTVLVTSVIVAVVPNIVKSVASTLFTSSLKATFQIKTSALVGLVVGLWRVMFVMVGAVLSIKKPFWLIPVRPVFVNGFPTASSISWVAENPMTIKLFKFAKFPPDTVTL